MILSFSASVTVSNSVLIGPAGVNKHSVPWFSRFSRHMPTASRAVAKCRIEYTYKVILKLTSKYRGPIFGV